MFIISNISPSPARITAFHDAWPKLEEWFGEKQNILVRVDATAEKEELDKRVEAVLQQFMLILSGGN